MDWDGGGQQKRRGEDTRGEDNWGRDGMRVRRSYERPERETGFERTKRGDVQRDVSPTPVSRAGGRRPAGTGGTSGRDDVSAATAAAGEAADWRAAEGRKWRERRGFARAGRDAEAADGHRGARAG